MADPSKQIWCARRDYSRCALTPSGPPPGYALRRSTSPDGEVVELRGLSSAGPKLHRARVNYKGARLATLF